VAYSGQARCCYTVQLFQHLEQQLVLKFQCLSSSPVQLWGKTNATESITSASLQLHSFLSKTKGFGSKWQESTVASVFGALSAGPACPMPLGSPVLDNSSVATLLSMAQSTLRDVSLEGIVTLAALSGSRSNTTLLAQEGCIQLIETLQSSLESQDFDTRYYSACLFRNMCNEKEFCSQAVGVLFSILARCLQSPQQSELANRGTKRELASALTSLTGNIDPSVLASLADQYAPVKSFTKK